MGHLPTDVAPDVRARDYLIEAHVRIDAAGAEGVLLAHGDATSGYSLYIQDGHLVHDMNIGGAHVLLRSDRPVPSGHVTLGFRMQQGPLGPPPPAAAALGAVPISQYRTGTLLINGEPAGSLQSKIGFNNFISWSGLDIGRDRGSPVSHYAAPFEFTGLLKKVTVTLSPPPLIEGDGPARVALARE
jgi:arylsulfatase